MATSPRPADPPLSLEPVVGWRIWRLERVNGVLKLGSVTRPDIWPPNRSMRARCFRHQGPSVGCTCGLYAASSPENLARSGMLTAASCVVGAIAMWGTVVEHARGARSQYAYPARLRLVCGECLAAGMGAVDPVIVAGAGPLLAVCERHRSDVRGIPSIPADQIQAELLSTYGVDLMPIERIDHTMRTRVGGTAPAAPVDPIKTVGRLVLSVVKAVFLGLFWLWALSGFIFVAVALLSGVASIFIHPHDHPTVATASPVAQTYVVVPPKHHHPYRGTPRPFRRPPPAWATVCGVGAGSHVEYAPCWDPGSDLMGFAERTEPKGPKTDCFGTWDAYTRGPHYSICWSSFGLPVFVHPWATAPSPWSVPYQEGGALHEHR
jgi:hypothetical protein